MRVRERWIPKTGERVRIRLSAECPGYAELGGDDGKVGEVVLIYKHEYPDGHCFRVDVPDTAYPNEHVIYAACELEQLEASA